MPLTEQIPNAAMRMVRIIQKEVMRPGKLPRAFLGRLCFARPGDPLLSSCPMGLIPGADELPITPGDLPDRISIRPAQVKAFAEWWDKQSDASAAVNAVWPSRTTTRRSLAKKK